MPEPRTHTTLHLTPKMLAARWHMASATLANQRSKGTGADFIRVGRHVLYPLDAVERYEAASLRCHQ